MCHVAGAGRHYFVHGDPPEHLVQYYAILDCPRCNTTEFASVLQLDASTDSPTAREQGARTAGPFRCSWCGNEIPFDEEAIREFLALFPKAA